MEVDEPQSPQPKPRPPISPPAQPEPSDPIQDESSSEPDTETSQPCAEEWELEAEIVELMPNVNQEIRGWHELRAQIISDLKKGNKKLPLSKVNQLMILRNFATLRLKGCGKMTASEEIARQWHLGEGVAFACKIRALARYYQLHEQLPEEQRGGARGKNNSLLIDVTVKTAARSWLMSQKVGTVTPCRFCHALNDAILPSINIILSKDLCERTARRWLLRLGFRCSILCKGIYKDGHDCADVKEYRDKTFLPKMKAFECRMTQYHPLDGVLIAVPPILEPGERELIALFHDECCFHANDFKTSAWYVLASILVHLPYDCRLTEGQSILQKKSRGRLIHVSEFINEKTGRLAVRDEDGKIIKEAHKIIYPGTNGDAWWDTEQLLTQVKSAITVFEEAHPSCQALFIFDQSSAHASLAPDALRAFEMNKSNGGKQQKQKDTVIPLNNPAPEYRGKVQKMTLANGEPKGLQLALKECGFDVKQLRAKCKPVCPFESQNCCMARLLSQQDDFKNQPSMLQTLITSAGHECIFLPKFHCELNPIEMVSDRHSFGKVVC